MSPFKVSILESSSKCKVNFCSNLTIAIFISVIANLSPGINGKYDYLKIEYFETFTNALSGTRAKRKPRKRFHIMNILFQESVRFENMWFRPVFRIVVDDIEWDPDQGSLLDDKSSKLS